MLYQDTLATSTFIITSSHLSTGTQFSKMSSICVTSSATDVKDFKSETEEESMV